MAVFSIIARNPNAALDERIKALYADHFSTSAQSWLIVTEGGAQMVARSLGVGERDANGVTPTEFGHILVIQLTSNYWGFGPSAQWDWLKSAFQRSPS